MRYDLLEDRDGLSDACLGEDESLIFLGAFEPAFFLDSRKNLKKISPPSIILARAEISERRKSCGTFEVSALNEGAGTKTVDAVNAVDSVAWLISRNAAFASKRFCVSASPRSVSGA